MPPILLVRVPLNTITINVKNTDFVNYLSEQFWSRIPVLLVPLNLGVSDLLKVKGAYSAPLSTKVSKRYSTLSN